MTTTAHIILQPQFVLVCYTYINLSRKQFPDNELARYYKKYTSNQFENAMYKNTFCLLKTMSSLTTKVTLIFAVL